jgi:HEAT repeat protein
VGVDPPARWNGGRTDLPHEQLEFFILTAVFDTYHSLSIFEDPFLAQCVNRRVPKFTREELIETLSHLFHGGDLIAWRIRNDRRSRPFVPSPDEIDAALCGALDIEYGLTPDGGARWEAMAQYDWNYHVGPWCQDGFDGPSQDMIEVYLAWDKRAAPGSERWRTIRPWKPTYWKSLPQGVRVRFQEPDPSCPRHRLISSRELWLEAWERARYPEMRTFIPMKTTLSSDAADRPWRIEYQSVLQGERTTEDLLRLLDADDPAIQYAAATRLAALNDVSLTNALIEWFLKRRTRFALRVVSRIDSPKALDAFIGVFKAEEWSGRSLAHRNRSGRTFRRDLSAAIGRFGEQAVPKLAPLLKSEVIEMQVAVLQTLGRTGAANAGTIILDWLPKLKPDNSREPDSLIRSAFMIMGIRSENARKYLRLTYSRISSALMALETLRDTRALPLLAEVLKVRPQCAMAPLARLKHPDAWKLLEDFARSDATIYDRWHALFHLAKAKPEYGDEFERVNGEKHRESLRRSANFLLGYEPTVDVPNLTVQLASLLGASNPELRASAISLLCRLETNLPIARVVELLDDSAPRVRANAAYALGLKGSPGEVSVIERLASDRSGLVRYCAREAMRLLEARHRGITN